MTLHSEVKCLTHGLADVLLNRAKYLRLYKVYIAEQHKCFVPVVQTKCQRRTVSMKALLKDLVMVE